MGFLRCFVFLALLGSVSFVVGRILPKFLFCGDDFPYRPYSFERDGAIYEKLYIKSWQNKLPDMSKLFPSLMPRKAIEDKSAVAFKRMIEETCVAEFTHTYLALVGFVCLALWKGVGGIVISLLFAFGNIPFIIIQRYNRPKLVRVYKKQLKREGKTLYPGGVLVLSCNTGGGHNSCADAICDEYVRNSEKCTVRDSLEFVSEDFSLFVSKWHTRLYSCFPSLFSFGYKFCEEHRSVMKAGGFVNSFFTRGSEALGLYIKSGGFHTVICTHVFAAHMLSDAIKRFGLECKSALVATDYTCCPGTADSNLNIFFSPAETVNNEFVRAGVRSSDIAVSGIPVRKSFYSVCGTKDDFSANKIHAVLMNGSMGCGNIDKLTEKLSRIGDNFCLTVVCGTNRKVKSKLDKRMKNFRNVRVLGYVENMSALMDTADFIITKPGGISTTEACVKKLPMLLIDAVAGCETYNLEYFVSAGAAVSADNISEAVRLCEMVCAYPEILNDMKANMPDMSVYSSEIIVNTMSLSKEGCYASV